MSRLRLAVVGTGHLGRIHARLAAASADFELVALVDPLPDQRDALAAELGVPAVAHHRELPPIDAAVVAVPTKDHAAVAGELLERGVHTFIEKPIAAQSREATTLVEFARRQALVLQVGHVERFNPAFVAVESKLRQPKFIDSVRRGPFSFRSTDIGVVLDLMIHDIDLVLALVPEPIARVEALGAALFGRHEDVAQARLHFAGGCVAQLSVSRASRTAARQMQIWSEDGLASLDFATNTATVIRPSDQIRAHALDVERLEADELARLRGTLLDEHLPQAQLAVEPQNQIAAELADFCASIRTGRQPRVTGAQARDAVAVAERILTAIESHAWDGAASGRCGPHGLRPPKILRGPHFHLDQAPARREAG